MKVNELRQYFRTHGVPDHFYSFGGLGAGECYGIEKIGTEWVVYYSEHGQKTPLDRFNDEDAACDQLLHYVNQMMKEDFNRTILPNRP